MYSALTAALTAINLHPYSEYNPNDSTNIKTTYLTFQLQQHFLYKPTLLPGLSLEQQHYCQLQTF